MGKMKRTTKVSIQDVVNKLDGLMNKVYMPKIESMCKDYIRDEVARQLESVQKTD